MPDRAPHFCAVPGCSHLVTGRHCRAHAVAKEQARPNYDLRRWYRTPQWKTVRARVLREQGYMCADCRQVIAALEVDHIHKHGGNRTAFWRRDNLQALCKPCHARKTLRGE